MQRSLDELASYVDHIASTSAKSALALQQATWEEKQQLELVVKQQSARLQQQAAQLEVLRGLAQQQLPPLPPPLAGSSSSSSAALWQDARLQQQLEWHKQVRAVWGVPFVPAVHVHESECKLLQHCRTLLALCQRALSSIHVKHLSDMLNLSMMTNTTALHCAATMYCCCCCCRKWLPGTRSAVLRQLHGWWQSRPCTTH
jgi:hypothetical protein